MSISWMAADPRSDLKKQTFTAVLQPVVSPELSDLAQNGFRSDPTWTLVHHYKILQQLAKLDHNHKSAHCSKNTYNGLRNRFLLKAMDVIGQI